MNDRERFVNCMLGKPIDHVPFWVFWGPWGTTNKRWEREGKPPKTDHRSFANPGMPPLTVPVKYGPCPEVPRKVLAKTERYVEHIDEWGIIKRDLRDSTSMAQFLKFPVAGWDDWRAYKHEHLDPEHPDRLAGDWLKTCHTWMDKGYPIQLGSFPAPSVYGGLRWMLGDEECLLAFYDAPDLVHDIMDHLTGVYLAVFAKVVAAGVKVDVIHVWEDMAGRQGPLISPAHVREFMLPCYRRIHQFAQEHAIPLISVDSDGWVDPLIPPLMEGGMNMMFPFEVAAGCDVNDYRKRYPQLGMFCGIDKRALAKNPAAIDAELDRVWPAVRAGRYIPDLDHLVPDDVSWDHYRYYVNALKERIFTR